MLEVPNEDGALRSGVVWLPFWARATPEQQAAQWIARAESFLGGRAFGRVLRYVGIPAALLFGASAVHRAASPFHSSEFRGFREIVQASLVRGENHYLTIPHIRAYPPFFAIAFAPFGLFPHPGGAPLFVGISLIFALWSAALCARACPSPGNERGRAVLLFLLVSGFIVGTIARCESDMLVLLPVVGAFFLLFRPGRRAAAAAGALLGFAAALKLTPALFGLYLLVQRRWAALLGMVGTGVLLAGGLGTLAWGVEGNLARHTSWYEVVVHPVAEEGPDSFIGRPYRSVNQSLAAAVFRLLTTWHGGRIPRGNVLYNVADLDPRTVLRLVNGLRAPILALTVAAWWRAARREEWVPQAAAFALAALGALLLSPVSLHTHHVTLMAVFGVLLAALAAPAEGRRSRVLAHLVAAGTFLMCLTVLDLGKAFSTLVLADLLFFAALLLLAFSPRGSGVVVGGSP